VGCGPVPGLPKHLPQTVKPVRAPAGSRVALDAGCGHTYATLNHPIDRLTDPVGKIPAARHPRRALHRLARAQVWLARTTPGSRRHRKALTRVRRLHHRVSSRRETWQRQLAAALAEEFETVVVETLNLKDDMHRQQAVRHLCVERHSGSSDSA
jgi:transposase